jgi:hypothetical protein
VLAILFALKRGLFIRHANDLFGRDPYIRALDRANIELVKTVDAAASRTQYVRCGTPSGKIIGSR